MPRGGNVDQCIFTVTIAGDSLSGKRQLPGIGGKQCHAILPASKISAQQVAIAQGVLIKRYPLNEVIDVHCKAMQFNSQALTLVINTNVQLRRVFRQQILITDNLPAPGGANEKPFCQAGKSAAGPVAQAQIPITQRLAHCQEIRPSALGDFFRLRITLRNVSPPATKVHGGEIEVAVGRGEERRFIFLAIVERLSRPEQP